MPRPGDERRGRISFFVFAASHSLATTVITISCCTDACFILSAVTRMLHRCIFNDGCLVILMAFWRPTACIVGSGTWYRYLVPVALTTLMRDINGAEHGLLFFVPPPRQGSCGRRSSFVPISVTVYLLLYMLCTLRHFCHVQTTICYLPAFIKVHEPCRISNLVLLFARCKVRGPGDRSGVPR